MAAVEQHRNLLTSMETSEWYTPREYLHDVRKLFGVIHLDPASCTKANEFVKAKRFFTHTDDGLKQDWYGNVFLNPPYCDFDNPRKPVTPVWTAKALHEFRNGKQVVTQMILLVNAKLGYKWFNDLVNDELTTTILHLDRLRFINAKNLILHNKFSLTPSRQPQATVYIGPNVDQFIESFKNYGWVIH